MKIAAIGPLTPLQSTSDDEDHAFLLEKVSPSGLSTFLAKQKRCLLLSTEIADIFNNLLKSDESARFSISTLCQLFSGEGMKFDFATQHKRIIPDSTPFAILGGIQMKPTVFLAHILDNQSSGLLDRVMFCAPKCLPPSMATAFEAANRLSELNFDTTFDSCMEQIFNAHPFPAEEDEPLIYKFENGALQHIHQLHDEFNTKLCDNIMDGSPTQASKDVELIERVAVALFVLDNTLKSVINKTPFTWPREIPLTTVEKAAKYVRHWEAQKEAIVKVSIVQWFFFSLRVLIVMPLGIAQSKPCIYNNKN